MVGQQSVSNFKLVVVHTLTFGCGQSRLVVPNVAKIAGTPAVRVRRMGGGTVTAMIDNPCFRGVWYGTRRLLLNALFFSGAVQSTGPIDKRTEDEAMDYDHGHAHDR